MDTTWRTPTIIVNYFMANNLGLDLAHGKPRSINVFQRDIKPQRERWARDGPTLYKCTNARCSDPCKPRTLPNYTVRVLCTQLVVVSSTSRRHQYLNTREEWYLGAGSRNVRHAGQMRRPPLRPHVVATQPTITFGASASECSSSSGFYFALQHHFADIACNCRRGFPRSLLERFN